MKFRLVVLAGSSDYNNSMAVILDAVVVWSTFVVTYTVLREDLD